MTAPPPFATLRRFLPGKRAERCSLCGADLRPDHPHLFESAGRQVLCACEPCGVLFDHRGQKYLRIGRDVRVLSDFRVSDPEWESLNIPIGLAFFVYSTAAARVNAFYPGPAGVTESLLPLESWNRIAARHPALAQMQPDIEALLVNRIGGARDHYLLPIDRCYQLVGLIRAHWHGLSGGEEVWSEINRFFAQLKEAQRA